MKQFAVEYEPHPRAHRVFVVEAETKHEAVLLFRQVHPCFEVVDTWEYIPRSTVQA